MILSAGGTESIILSAGSAKQQSTISCSKNVATMAAAEATVAAATDLMSVATTTTVVKTVTATATLTVTAATKQLVS
jgi:hypothetical protein